VLAQQDVVATQGVVTTQGALHTVWVQHCCRPQLDRQPRASAIDGDTANATNRPTKKTIRFMETLLHWAK
jgi:hypothetical protein